MRIGLRYYACTKHHVNKKTVTLRCRVRPRQRRSGEPNEGCPFAATLKIVKFFNPNNPCFWTMDNLQIVPRGLDRAIKHHSCTGYATEHEARPARGQTLLTLETQFKESTPPHHATYSPPAFQNFHLNSHLPQEFM